MATEETPKAFSFPRLVSALEALIERIEDLPFAPFLAACKEVESLLGAWMFVACGVGEVFEKYGP